MNDWQLFGFLFVLLLAFGAALAAVQHRVWSLRRALRAPSRTDAQRLRYEQAAAIEAARAIIRAHQGVGRGDD